MSSLKKILLLLAIVTFCFASNTKANQVDDTFSLQNLINKAIGKLTLEKREYSISSTINLKSGITIIGNGATFKKVSKGKPFYILQINNINNVTISDLNITGDRHEISNSDLSIYMADYGINMLNSSNITFSNMKFSELVSSGIRIHDVHNLYISNCKFENIGLSTQKSAPKGYNYDCIFIGGDTLSDSVTIQHCIFRNIGYNNSDMKYGNDADGVQVLMRKGAKANNFDIKFNTFDGVSARGIKIQSGSNIKITNNSFKNCHSATGIVMADNIQDLVFSTNTIDSCSYVLSPNSSAIFYIKNFTVENNIASNIDFFIRLSGKSTIQKANFNNNQASNIGYSFASGRFNNTNFVKNTIRNYAIGGNPSFYMAFLIAPESDTVNIQNNTISGSAKKSTIVYFQGNPINTRIQKNNFHLLSPNKLDESNFVHFSGKAPEKSISGNVFTKSDKD